jgi:hypothetical protein
MEAPQKTKKIDLPYDPPISLSGMYPKEYKSIYKRDTCIPMFTAGLFTVAKLWNQEMCPTNDKLIQKIW